MRDEGHSSLTVYATIALDGVITNGMFIARLRRGRPTGPESVI